MEVLAAVPGDCCLPMVGGVPDLRCVLFDAGLTLIQAVTSTDQMARLALRKGRIAAPRSEVRAAMAVAERQLADTWQQGDWFASEAGVRELFVGCYTTGLARLSALRGDSRRTATIAAEMYDEYAEPRHWTLYPEVVRTLESLHLAGIVMGVVSDWGHGLEGLLLELGLGKYLSFQVVSARLGVTKPDPIVFRMALDRVGVEDAASLYVGDTYVKDVLGARAAGIIPVLLDRDGTAPSLDCPTIASLDGLLSLVGLDRTGANAEEWTDGYEDQRGEPTCSQARSWTDVQQVGRRQSPSA